VFHVEITGISSRGCKKRIVLRSTRINRVESILFSFLDRLYVLQLVSSQNTHRTIHVLWVRSFRLGNNLTGRKRPQRSGKRRPREGTLRINSKQRSNSSGSFGEYLPSNVSDSYVTRYFWTVVIIPSGIRLSLTFPTPLLPLQLQLRPL
jgi:hypothetical protein